MNHEIFDLEEQKPEFYEIVPQFNRQGRLCNYGSGNAPTVKVPQSEWERFSQLAGRQHRITNGIVVFDETLAPCLPDKTINELKRQLMDMDYKTSKRADGEYTEAQWAAIAAKRKAIREQIKVLELEAEVNGNVR